MGSSTGRENGVVVDCVVSTWRRSVSHLGTVTRVFCRVETILTSGQTRIAIVKSQTLVVSSLIDGVDLTGVSSVRIDFVASDPVCCQI